MIIDLHGLTEHEALLEIDSALLSLEFGYEHDYVEIITGRGFVLRRVAIDYVEDEGYFWEHPNGNEGSIVVYKK